MNKPLLVISAPVEVFSGYSARSRDIVKYILKTNKYEVKILSQKWGSCPFGFLQKENPEHKQILDCILQTPQLEKQPDIWIQICTPPEMQKIGKFNILFTAGIETTICDPTWIEGCNRADLVIVSSKHAEAIFKNTKFEKRDNNNKLLEIIELKTPCEVLFEGVDTNIYKKLETINKDILEDIGEKFNFLFVGHWLSGDLGQDRKDVGMLIKTFLETFKGKPIKPGLIIKSSGATYSIIDKESILDKIQGIQNLVGDIDKQPNIYLIHGSLEEEELNELYNNPKIKSFISFTKGEGYGRPLLEASIAAKPTIVSNWSGHLDFLKQELNLLIPGNLTQIHNSAVVQNVIIPESSWFTINYREASKQMLEVYRNYNKFLDNAKKQSYISRKEFNLEKMGERLEEIIDKRVPKVIELKLPVLQRVD